MASASAVPGTATWTAIVGAFALSLATLHRHSLAKQHRGSMAGAPPAAGVRVA